jgi:hypothetical protein
MRVLPRDWFRVPVGERELHRMLGIGVFGWLFESSGWNRHVADPLRAFNGRRNGSPSLEQSARGGAIAHGACFAVQRSIMLRLQPVSDKSGSWDCDLRPAKR